MEDQAITVVKRLRHYESISRKMRESGQWKGLPAIDKKVADIEKHLERLGYEAVRADHEIVGVVPTEEGPDIEIDMSGRSLDDALTDHDTGEPPVVGSRLGIYQEDDQPSRSWQRRNKPSWWMRAIVWVASRFIDLLR